MRRSVTRRQFLETAALTGAALGLASTWPGLAFADGPERKLKVLVLGGTGQTGPHLVRQLLERGHTVTLFNRGNRSAELFPDVECIIGDRALDAEDGMADLEAELANGRTWDLCMDIWPHIPKMVEVSGELLRDHVGHYMYVSSLSVYADQSVRGIDETAEVEQAPNADELEYTGELFGAFKAEAEKRVRRIYPENHTIYRPGLIVGPRDASFRGVYWPVRVRRGGEVLAPGDGSDRIQQIDARDLTRFEVHCMEKGIGGTFNVVGPHPSTPLTMARYLQRCREATGGAATFTWADAEFLGEQGVGPWMHMPNWVPAEGDFAGFGHHDVSRAVAAGLIFRPLVDTIRDTLAWYDELDAERRTEITARAGITADREAEVLAAYHVARG